MLVIKRKLYSKSSRSSLRIKRFSRVKEEERLYAVNPFATIRRVNTLRTANNAYKGLNFRQALSQYRQRGQLATTARSIHKPMVSGWAKNGRLDYRSLQGGILSGNNLGKSNLVGLSAGVKQASTNISNNVRSSSGGGLFKNLFRNNKSADSIMRKDIFKTSNPITNQHITQSKNLVNSLQNAGVTNANIGNLTGAQKNQLLNPTLQKSTYNPALDPKTLNTNFMGSGQIPVQKGTKQQTLIDNKGFEKVNKSQRRTGNSVLNQEVNQLSKNNQKGQSYYESVFKETGADANSMNNTTFSRSKVMEQQNPVKTQPTQPQPKSAQTQEKPFETSGLKEQPNPITTSPTTNQGAQAEKTTKTSNPVENNNPQLQTTTTKAEEVSSMPKPDYSKVNSNEYREPITSSNKPTETNKDNKFKLGWKGKAALGTLALGGAAYGGAKLVNDAIDDQDKRS